MNKHLYASDTTPASAAQISADSGEIVHVHCGTPADRRGYADALSALLDDSDEFGGGSEAELEIVGDLDGHAVRVHLALA